MQTLRRRKMSRRTGFSFGLMAVLAACGSSGIASDKETVQPAVATLECIRPVAVQAPAEPMEILVRRFQTELMVAALSCGMRGDYNAFVSTYKPELTKHGKALQSHFSRNYGAGHTKQLNKFVTALANEASAASLADHNGYCGAMAARFQQMKDGNVAKLDEFVTKPIQVAFGDTDKACSPLQATAASVVR